MEASQRLKLVRPISNTAGSRVGKEYLGWGSLATGYDVSWEFVLGGVDLSDTVVVAAEAILRVDAKGGAKMVGDLVVSRQPKCQKAKERVDARKQGRKDERRFQSCSQSSRRPPVGLAAD